MKKNYLYLFLTALIVLILNEVFIFEPNFFFISVSINSLIISLYIKSIIKKNSSKFWPLFIITPVLFYLGFSFYSAIIVGSVWIQLTQLLIVWFLFSYLHNIYYYHSFGAPERESKLRRLLLSGSFLSAFAFAATIYALPIFLSWPSGLLLILFSIISFLLFGQFLIFAKNIDKEKKMFLGINVLVLTELAGVFFLLPLNYNILGLLLAIIFYVLVLFDEWREEGRLIWKDLRWPIFISAFIFIIILLSARWL